MKKQTLIILILLIVVILVVAFAVIQNVQKERELANYNSQYEKYVNGQQLDGTDVATLINKAMNDNQKNNVEKDEKGYYINNNTNSIKLYIKLVQDGEDFPMERIFEVGKTEFVKNFNIEDFKCTKINYHKETGMVSEVYFEVI